MSQWTGALSTDWNNVGNWTAGIPTASIDAIFTGTPTNPCILGVARVCKALTFTAYTSTVNLATHILTVNGDITFQANQESLILGSTGILLSNINSTVFSNGGVWRLNYRLAASITITLTGIMTVLGSYSTVGGTNRTVNGGNLFVATNVSNGGAFLGTSDLIMNGSGTYSGTGASNLEINTTGTITITGTVFFTRKFVVVAAFSLTMTAANFIFQNITVDVGGREVGNINMNVTGTVSYSTNIICAFLNLPPSGVSTLNGPGKIFVKATYTLGSANISGNLVIELIGAGSISAGAMTLATIINNSGAGTYNLPASMNIHNSLTYTSGSVDAGTGLVTLINGCVLATSGINFFNVSVTNGTVTINSTLTITGTLTLATLGDVIFNGTAGWTCANLIVSTGNKIITLQQLITYFTTFSVSLIGGNTAPITMTSSSASLRANWILTPAASQVMAYVNGTRIDSSAGQTIWPYEGVLTDTINWYKLLPPSQISFMYIG